MSFTRVLSLIALVAVGGVVTSILLQDEPPAPPPNTSAPAVSTSTQPEPALDLPVLREAPPLVNLDGWLQTPSQSLDDFRGRVVVLQFWTFSCHNCKATIPNLQNIYSMYDRSQLEIVGVHAPEFSFEEDPDAVLAAAADLGVTWPIALDTSKRNFHSWQEGPTAYWPRTYVIDPEGSIRFDHIGEGKYDELRDSVAALIAEL